MNGASATVSGRHTFDMLSSSAGDLFRARLTVCRKSDSGDCGAPAESAPLRRPRPPTRLSLSVSPAGSANLEVSYTPSEEPHRYVTELHGSASETGTYAREGSVKTSASSRPSFLDQDRERWYKARTKNCIDAAHTRCGLWSEFSDAQFLHPKLAAPTGLDVVPMPLRMARLTWTPSANADSNTEYRIEIAAASNPNSWATLFKREADPTEGHVIHLDNVLSGKGLADEDYFDIKIIAKDPTGAKLDSDDSEEIRIIDSPILTSGRANGNSPGERGQVTLQWSRIVGATGYTVRYGAILQGFHSGVGAIPPHSDEDWAQYSDWPYVNQTLSTKSVQQPSSGPVSTEITSLGKLYTVLGNQVYAFQINYETASNVKVFSGRYAFVWPSGKFPEEDTRVGTYPFFGHHPNREFKYIICQSEFPSADWTTWQSIIENAFGQWQVATDEFITMIRDQSSDCPQDPQSDASKMRQFIFQDDQQSEVRMLDLQQSGRNIWSFPEVKSDLFKGLCVPIAAACTTSFPGYSGISHDDDRRQEILTLLEDDDLHAIDIIRAFFKLVHADRKAENELQSVDITFNSRSTKFLSIHFNQPSRVSFNTCLSNMTTTNSNPDFDYHAYEVAVHEAGHALGLANITLNPLQLSQPYQVAHPTIPDSVMNYDTNVPRDWSMWAPSPLDEPDCSPYPFDIMAIYALYQTVPRVSISGPTSQRELTQVNLTVDQVSHLTPPYAYKWSVEPSDLTFSPNDTSRSVSITLPDVDASDPVKERRVVVEVKVTDADGKMHRNQHAIIVNP